LIKQNIGIQEFQNKNPRLPVNNMKPILGDEKQPI
jgi:hypothetical protein